MYILYIVPESETQKPLYEAIASAYMSKAPKERDAGFDTLSVATSVSAGALGHKISQLCKAAFFDTERGTFRAFFMLPRSSISKTPLRLANSVGLIDAGYRGTLLAAVDSRDDYVVADHTRLFQIASPDLLPFDEIWVVPEIPGGPTLRGAGGFGSTGSSAISLPMQSQNTSTPGHGYFTAPE